MRLTDSQRATTKLIFSNPGITRIEILRRTAGGWRNSHINMALKSLTERGLVEEKNEVLTLSPEMHEYVESIMPKGELVKSAEPQKFRPLNAKYIPSAAGTRDDGPVREFHPHSLVSNVPATGAGF